MKWVEHIAHIGKMRNLYKILIGKPQKNRPFGRPTYRWEDNIKMDFKETELKDVYC
jgi:hypothetical protein